MMEDVGVPYQGQDSGFIWVEESGVIMCDPKYTLIDFETEYEPTEDEVKDGAFYVPSARIEGEYYSAD